MYDDPVLASCSRPPMNELAAIYEQLARPWTPDQLAAHYRDANSRGERMPDADSDDALRSSVAVLASCVPASASLSVAIHVLHLLPSIPSGELAEQLLGTVDENAAAVLHRCHWALELDGRAHDYAPDEWLPIVYDIAAPHIAAARLHQEPPAVVEHAQEAIRWLARAIIDLDRAKPDASAAIAETLARMLTLSVFADVARGRVGMGDQ